MMEYTKMNVLTQSAQAMLAQANQYAVYADTLGAHVVDVNNQLVVNPLTHLAL